MGLNAGPVPPRVDGPVKQALLGLAADAVSAGFSLRQAATWLGVNHTRLLQWRTRDQAGRGLHDEPAGPVPGEVLHALLDLEKAAIIALAADWERVDLSHRKLAHRGSRLDVVYVSESSVLRVLTEAGVRLPGLPALPRRERTPFPDWAELVPGVVWCYDFTHFSGLPGWCAIAVVDVISKYCLALNLCPEETSIQVENAFIDALQADGKAWLLDDEEFLAELTTGHVPDPDFDHLDDTSHLVPVLLAVSDNGPQMTSKATAKFMAAARIGQHFGRPGTPNDQAWIESFFGHLKTENPHLDTIKDPAVLRAELDHLGEHYNTVRLHEGIGYVTPDDEHHGRGPAIRKARRDGLEQARRNRVATRRHNRQNQPKTTSTAEDN